MTLIYAPVPYIFTKQIHAVEASYLIPDCMVDVVLPFLKPFFFTGTFVNVEIQGESGRP